MNGSSLGLWRRWRERRDAAAFGRLVREHIGFAFDFARRVTGHHADAEDVAQQALLELAEADTAVLPRVGIRAFLGRRIVFGARTLRRAALTRHRLEARAAKPEATVSPRGAAADEVQRALELLDAEQRHAVVLRFLHGLAYAEVAHCLGVSEEAARMRVHRALERLRRELCVEERAGDREADGRSLLAPLAVFAPPSGLAGSVTRTAVAGWSATATGAVVMGLSLRNVLLSLALLATLAGGFVIWRADRATGERVVQARHERESAGDADPAAVEPRAADLQADPEPENPASQPDPDPTPEQEPVPAAEPGLSGTLRDAGGAPMVDVRITGDHGPGVATDGHGRFRLEPRAGDVWLYLTGRNGLRVQLAQTVFDPEHPAQLDLQLDHGYTLKGRVTESAKEPSQDVLMLVSREGGHHQSVQGASAWVRTNRDGTFAVPHLPPGTYSVWATPFRAGLRDGKTQVEIKDGDAFVEIELASAPKLGVRILNVPAALSGLGATLMLHRDDMYSGFGIELEEGIAVQMTRPPPGRYRFALALEYTGATAVAEHELTVDATGDLEFRIPPGGALNATVRGAAGPLADRTVRVGDASGTTDGEGFVSWPYLKPGTYDVRVEAGSGWLRSGTVTVRAGAANELALRQPGTAMLAGRVDVKQRVGDVSVVVQRLPGGSVVARLDIDGSGRFALDLLEAGDYVVRADADPAYSPPKAVRLEAGGRRDVGVLKLARPPRVPVVVEVPRGVAYPGRVEIRGPGVDDTARLDSKGRGVLTATLPGTHRVTVTAKGFAPLELEISVPGTARFELTPE